MHYVHLRNFFRYFILRDRQNFRHGNVCFFSQSSTNWQNVFARFWKHVNSFLVFTCLQATRIRIVVKYFSFQNSSFLSTVFTFGWRQGDLQSSLVLDLLILRLCRSDRYTSDCLGFLFLHLTHLVVTIVDR